MHLTYKYPRTRQNQACFYGAETRVSLIEQINFYCTIKRGVHKLRINKDSSAALQTSTVLAASNCVEHDGTSYAPLKRIEAEF